MCARPYSARNSQKILGEKKESESSLQILHAEMHAWLHRLATSFYQILLFRRAGATVEI
jgi:hypothetical protein